MCKEKIKTASMDYIRRFKGFITNKRVDSKQSIKVAKTPKRLVSAAIDLGTTYSGYAYSFNAEPRNVTTNQRWVAGGMTLLSMKAPTCVLLDNNRDFHSFGYEAQNNYSARAEEGDHKNWYFFDKFKMMLYKDKSLTMYSTIEDATGKKMNAITIFAMAIKYLKGHLMATLLNRVTNVTFDDITFVLTVPAIWNDRAKQFMREAAIRAGIPIGQVIIALEPEVASVWCQGLCVEKVDDSNGSNIEPSPAGSKCMIVDIGGGTADITIHEKQTDDTLREIHLATGGPWGGTAVDKDFLHLLGSILTTPVMEKFKQTEMADLIDLMRDFEIKKRTFSKDTSRVVTIKIPASLKELFVASGQRLADLKERMDGMVEWKGDKLKIHATLIKQIFHPTIDSLIAHVFDLLDKKGVDVEKILLVGGFAESAFVKESFKDYFREKTIIIPAESELCVLKGAVLFGHDPKVVKYRVARYTYGIETALPFDPRIHPPFKRCETPNGLLCRQAFWKAIEIGTPLMVGHEVTRIGTPVFDSQCQVRYGVYRSTSPNPVLVTDPSCEKIGEICIETDPTKPRIQNELEEIFSFGDTSIRFFTKHKLTNESKELFLHL